MIRSYERIIYQYILLRTAINDHSKVLFSLQLCSNEIVFFVVIHVQEHQIRESLHSAKIGSHRNTRERSLIHNYHNDNISNIGTTIHYRIAYYLIHSLNKCFFKVLSFSPKLKFFKVDNSHKVRCQIAYLRKASQRITSVGRTIFFQRY